MDKPQTASPEFDFTAPSEFEVGDKVFAIDKNKYDIYQAEIKKVVGPHLYEVIYPDYETEETVEQERILVRNEVNLKIYEEQERVRNDIEEHEEHPQYNEEEQAAEQEASRETSDEEPQEQPELIEQGDSDHQVSDQTVDYIPQKRKYTKRKGPKKPTKKTGKVGRPRIHPLDEYTSSPVRRRQGRRQKSLKRLEEEQLAAAIAASTATANAESQNNNNEETNERVQNNAVPAASGNITFSRRPQNMEISSSQQADGAVTISFKIYFN